MPAHPLPATLIHTPRRPILVRSPRMQNMSIRQQLNIPWLQNHMQRQPRSNLIQRLQRMLLRLAQSRYHCTSTTVIPPQRGNIVGVEFEPHALAVALGVQHAGNVPGVLALCDLAFAVKVPVWSCEGLDYVGVFALKGVVDVVRGGDVGFAAGEGFGDAEEADEVGAVCVVELSISGMCENGGYLETSGKGRGYVLGVGAVDPHFILLRSIFTQVFDVSEHMSATILTD